MAEKRKVAFSIAHVSGGFDSAAAVLKELEDGITCKGLFINYGQPYARQEQNAAVKFSDAVGKSEKYNSLWSGLEIITTELQLMVPLRRQIIDAYVPMRNLILTSIAVNVAVAQGYDAVTVGSKTLKVRKNDPYSFSDCSVAFYSLLEHAVLEGSEDPSTAPQIRMPLVYEDRSSSKKEVLQMLIDCGFSYMVDQLWTCYESSPEPCGTCYHCEVLREAKKEIDL